MVSTPAQQLWHLATAPLRRVPPTLLALTARWLPAPLRLASSEHWVVIRHPFASYSAHLVAVARRARRDMLTPAEPDEWIDLIRLSARLASERQISRLALLSNVGAFQAVRQLHFHLVPSEEFAPLETRSLVFAASCLDNVPTTIAALAEEALATLSVAAGDAPALRLFVLDVDGTSRQRPIVAVEVGGERRA